MRAIDRIRDMYITENELAELLNVDTKRIRDLRSFHVTGKEEFIDHIKPSGKCRLYHFEDVLKYLQKCEIQVFAGTKKS